MFFARANKETALGMYSPMYFITLLFFLIITTLAIILSKKMKKETVHKVLVYIGIFLWLTEFGKMVFHGITYGLKSVEYLPLYFCSMTMYACILLCFKNSILQKTACSFLFFGGIVGAISFFLYPDACVPNYPLFHYMTLRTFIYHSLMIYMGFLIVITKYYIPKLMDFKYYIVFLGITFIFAYTINITNNQNLMYIQKPLKIKISESAYEILGGGYPFIVGMLEAVVPFFISYGSYKFVLALKNTITKKIKNGCNGIN